MLRKTIPFKSNPRDVVLFGLLLFGFVLAFLILYQPFFIQSLSRSEVFSYALKVASFSAMLCAITFPLAIRLNWHRSEWNMGKEILWNLGHLLIIGSFNTLLSRAYPTLYDFTWVEILCATSLVGIIPIGIDVAFRLRKSPHPTASSNPESVASNIVYVKSDGNYLEIYSTSDNEVKTELVRGSLRQFLSSHTDEVLQVHRSYLVNPKHVRLVHGNSNGGRLKLDNDLEVPFSRSYYANVLSLKQGVGPSN